MSCQRYSYVQTAGSTSQRTGSARVNCLIRGSGDQASVDRRVMEGCPQSAVLIRVEYVSINAHARRSASYALAGI